MFKELAKIWKDTTTNTVTGEYSLKRLQAFFASLFAVLLTMPFIIHLNLWPEQSFSLKEPPFEVLLLWVSVALGFTGLIITGKFFSRKTADGNGNPLEPTLPEAKSENLTEEQP